MHYYQCIRCHRTWTRLSSDQGCLDPNCGSACEVLDATTELEHRSYDNGIRHVESPSHYSPFDRVASVDHKKPQDRYLNSPSPDRLELSYGRSVPIPYLNITNHPAFQTQRTQSAIVSTSPCCTSRSNGTDHSKLSTTTTSSDLKYGSKHRGCCQSSSEDIEEQYYIKDKDSGRGTKHDNSHHGSQSEDLIQNLVSDFEVPQIDLDTEESLQFEERTRRLQTHNHVSPSDSCFSGHINTAPANVQKLSSNPHLHESKGGDLTIRPTPKSSWAAVASVKDTSGTDGQRINERILDLSSIATPDSLLKARKKEQKERETAVHSPTVSSTKLSTVNKDQAKPSSTLNFKANEKLSNKFNVELPLPDFLKPEPELSSRPTTTTAPTYATVAASNPTKAWTTICKTTKPLAPSRLTYIHDDPMINDTKPRHFAIQYGFPGAKYKTKTVVARI